ncbi:MAG: DUF3857 domain-containing protein [candidate division Zixibacteria bacterium]|nr:DUF3857 domain-containing protein [candidate division Zixibacteria bacterium]
MSKPTSSIWPTRRRVLALVLFCVLALPSLVFANDISWSSYPAYYETDEWSIEWSSRRRLTVEAHRVIRVNRTTGVDAGRIRIWDTFFQRLQMFEGTVTDTFGNILFELTEDEVESVEPFSDFRLYSGDVIRSADLVAPRPPYIIEARWQVEIENVFFWPDWVIGDRWPRRHASYQVHVPRRENIHYQQVAPTLVQYQEDDPRGQIHRWELNNWIPEDIGSAGEKTLTPLLHVAPEEFRVGGEEGATDSWHALGEWYWELTKDRFGLDDDQKRWVDAQVQDVIGDRAQASVLKDWVSDEWRYVAIEIGLGGWRPHASSEVFDTKYGDCKDVVFLWISMLHSLGMEAYPALIRSRNPLPLDPTFPKDWFDHVVAMAIIDGDTLWADPSDSRYRLGSLPPSCEERWALVVGPLGGQLVQTPCKTSDDNRQRVRCEGELDADGNLSFHARVVSSGHFAAMTPANGGRNGSELAAAILGVMPAATLATIDAIEVISPSEIATTISGRIDGWAIGGTRRMVVRPRLGGWMANDTIGGRIDPGTVRFPVRSFDTIVVHFPAGWQPELWPTAEYHSTANGEFGEARSFESGRLEVVRHLRWEKCDRSPSSRRENKALRDAFQAARSGEWVFNHIEESNHGDTSHHAADSLSKATRTLDETSETSPPD